MSSNVGSSSGRFPIVTSLPGHVGKRIILTFGTSGILSGEFVGTDSSTYTIDHVWQSDTDLLVTVSDGSLCQFVQWPADPGQPPYKNFMSAQGLTAVTPRVGIATHIYVYARLVLAEKNLALCPSDNQMPDGKELWQFLDNGIKWQKVPHTGGYQPDLTGLLPP
jgi:hypothetical protein